MRLVKILLGVALAALALTVGLVVAAGLAVAGLATYFYLRIRGPRRQPAVATRFPARPGAPGEIIEIEATEVPPGKPGP
ncbi:MAG: hypothetical protein ACO3G4_11580 [Opitutaceae bacterium]